MIAEIEYQTLKININPLTIKEILYACFLCKMLDALSLLRFAPR